jgi:hypothetical protein
MPTVTGSLARPPGATFRTPDAGVTVMPAGGFAVQWTTPAWPAASTAPTVAGNVVPCAVMT